VLIVDDDAGVRALLERLLAEAGLEIATAAGVAEARQLAPAWRPDVLLADVRLADGSGIDLAVELLAAQPGLRVVRMTGSDETGEVPWPVLTKPFDLALAVRLVAGRRP